MNFFTFRLKAVLGLWAQLVGFIFTARDRAHVRIYLRIRRQIKDLSANYPNAPLRQETKRQKESNNFYGSFSGLTDTAVCIRRGIFARRVVESRRSQVLSMIQPPVALRYL